MSGTCPIERRHDAEFTGPHSRRGRSTLARSRINGVRIYRELAGDTGDPMVLVHGSWGDHANWAPVVPGLARDFRVLTYDRRGHSRSERLPGQGSVREDVEDLAALLEELGHAPAHVVGTSFGGAIVLRLAAAHPHLLRSLVVHEPPLIGLLDDDPEVGGMLAAIRERIAATVSMLASGETRAGARQFVETIAFGPGAWDELPEVIRETFVANASTWLDEMRDPESLELDVEGLRGFDAPVLLTYGDQGAPFFRLIVNRLASAIPHAVLHTYAGAGHSPHSTHSDAYVRTVSEFVRGVTV
jgi:pimeloyl-ACP methyl ester carboxylesterase